MIFPRIVQLSERQNSAGILRKSRESDLKLTNFVTAPSLNILRKQWSQTRERRRRGTKVS